MQGNSDGIGCKVLYEEGLVIYEDLIIYEERKPLVIYDFATDPFRISLYMKKFYYLFYQCTEPATPLTELIEASIC